MKKLIILLIIGMMVNQAFGQARLGQYPWAISLKVVDENQQPVGNARAWIAYGSVKEGESTDPFVANGWAKSGLTDTNGLFTASHKDRTWTLGINVEKSGYYSVHISYGLYVRGQFDDRTVEENRSPKLTVVLKKIINPIPMYAKPIQEWPQKSDGTNGYDLTVGDWVGPNRKGVNADIVFIKKMEKKASDDYDYTLRMHFPKKGDGIQEFIVPKIEAGSELRSPQQGPPDGYQSDLIRTVSHHPGQVSISGYDVKRIYLFRVKTVLDDHGNVLSTHYGKIYGDPLLMNFIYYLNEQPNSRNIEFNPKRNLISNLKPYENVGEP